MKNGAKHNGRSALILGAASTVARAIAHEFAGAGYALVLADCDEEETARVAADIRVRFCVPCHSLAFDATAFDTHKHIFERCQELLGGLPGGLVLCFGYMTEQARAQADSTLAQRTIDTNFTGAVSILELFAQAFEKHQSGFIAVLSSVAGDRGRQANYIYGASKGGLTVYLQGLRNRLHAAKVQVTTVKPGFMDTKMTYGMNLPARLTASPQCAARAVFKAIMKGKDEVYVPCMWRYIMLIIKCIPEFQFKKMNI